LPHSSRTGKRMKRINIGEMLLAKFLEELGLEYATQVGVCFGRRWRWDFFLPDFRVAIEVDGYFKGRHGSGYGADNEKANYGTMNGIRVLRFSTQDVKTGKAKKFLQEWLKR
jgi:very-short-patch-repair endonuclease